MSLFFVSYCQFWLNLLFFNLIIGMIVISLTVGGTIPWTGYHALVILVFAASLFGYVYSLGLMEAYELLVRNEKHTGSLWFRLKKKIREKL